ncbi:MAG TPA: metal-dependent transcriptional regulator [Bacilli bacterium]|jgi:DtxR family Mn-dependent transcriptional regulator|nr:metal-dependent transcriptional regulator [Bacilli bacterium]NLT01766.1 metal-dependent transcriptional regulator [Acholeplasmataceae bacterium]HNZ77279.1 metal-dependent transcriptional regulator [Bacilli bacterium]HOD60622.1 metal-dependent transcriptional regulator [Bacilli bacterium]HOH60985.1 metal-dependent transcriptional regulator [Bacilli bacterium]
MKELTKAKEDYLEAILMLEKSKGIVRTSEIARLLNVSRPGVTKAMNALKAAGLIEKENYGAILLTKAGRLQANEILNRHNKIKMFLIKLGVSPETAELDCCKIEHVISDETFEKIKNFIKQKPD